MGATNQQTRKRFYSCDFADSIDHNAVHGSDNPSNAKQEIGFFFLPEEIVTYVKSTELA